tara:strand:- start:5302 stop:6171 length:870 start_codon:yes stop_codon:yes gene_type:complete
MKANPDEHLRVESGRSSFPFLELFLALAVIGGLVFYWFQSEEKKSGPSVVSVPAIAVPAMQPDLPTTPDIPQQPEPVAVLAGADNTVLAAETSVDQIELMDGDSMLRQELAATGTDSIMSKLMSNEHPINVSAAFIDGLGRGVILKKLLPGDPPKQAFSVVEEDEVIYISPSSYQRYDSYTDILTALDSKRLVSSFHALRPIYEQAFQYLGLDPGDFDNTIIRALDQVLATPEIIEPIALQPKSVVYIFADPALENLPPVQKQLLRMGPDNISRIKQQARALREGLLAQ